MKSCEKNEYGEPRLIDVPVLQTSNHWGNRGGVYTQGKACKTLLRNLGTDGFVMAEANNSPIVVRERQLNDRPQDYETFLDYNLRKSAKDELLAGAYLPTDKRHLCQSGPRPLGESRQGYYPSATVGA